VISITTKSPYALRALAELGRSGDAGPVPIGELARRRDIPDRLHLRFSARC
jgi:Rrf2 family cysteine metabolism transcriptional repressor